MSHTNSRPSSSQPYFTAVCTAAMEPGKKKSDLFLKAVSGTRAAKGELRAVNVIQEIRDEVCSALMPDHESAVAEDTAAAEDAHDEPDPMEALDDVIMETPKKTRKLPCRIARQYVLQKLEMPLRPLCTRCATEEKTTIMLYCVSKRHGKPTIYLQVDHLD